MTVKHSLLAILAQGPCYGYQLRAEFERRTAHTWSLNVGQIYNTLDRLERAEHVTRGDADENGHVFWAITPSGLTEVARWLETPLSRASERDDVATKVALATSLPGVDATAVIRAEFESATRRATVLIDAQAADADPRSRLIRSGAILRAEADVAWLALAADAVQQGDLPEASPVVSDRPRRGRPRRSVA